MHLSEPLLGKLKPFLNQRLSPICDADPEVLSEYVLALLKHDLPSEQLKEKCKAQLSDFLREHTNEFVEQLFAFIAQHSAPVEQVSFSMDEASDEERTPEAPPANKIQATNESASLRSKGKICRNFARSGKCPLGDKCRFEHRLPPTAGSRFVLSRTALVDDPEARRLVVDKIPNEHCNQKSVFHYFKRFGFIRHIDMEPEYKRASILYSSHEDAVRAFQSPESMFGNRFVRIFWDANQEISPEQQEQANAKPTATARFQTQESLGGKREFLLEQQRTIMERLKDKEISDADREELFQSLERISGILSQPTVARHPPQPPSYYKPFAPTKRNISQTFGGDIAEPSRKKSMSIDFRPKALLVNRLPTGTAPSDIVASLKQWQPIGDAPSLDENGHLEIAFAERYQAEAALNYLLSSYPSGDLQVSWQSK